MDLLMLLAILGGVYVLLAFWHFPADWLFQSQKEALAKAKNHLVRARHCLVYTTMYVPLLLLLRLRINEWDGLHLASLDNVFWCMAILWVSHFFIDTYLPVMWWAKYLRRDDHFKHVKRYGRQADGSYTMTEAQYKQFLANAPVNTTVGWSDKVVDEITYSNDTEAFKAFFMTPIGGILCITMDQLFHLSFLWPVAWLIAN